MARIDKFENCLQRDEPRKIPFDQDLVSFLHEIVVHVLVADVHDQFLETLQIHI